MSCLSSVQLPLPAWLPYAAAVSRRVLARVLVLLPVPVPVSVPVVCVTRAGRRTSVVRVGFRRRPHFLQDFIDRLKNQQHSHSPSANKSETARFAWLESGEPHIRDERPQEAVGVHRQAISEVLSHARTFSQGLT